MPNTQSAEADQVTAKAEIELLENELVRINRLKQSAAFSKAQLEDKLRQIAVAKSRLERSDRTARAVSCQAEDKPAQPRRHGDQGAL